MLVLQRLSSSSPNILAHLFLLLKRKHFTSPPHKLYWKTPHIHRKMLDGKFSYLGDIVQYLEPLNLGITTEPFFILWFFTFFFFFFLNWVNTAQSVAGTIIPTQSVLRGGGRLISLRPILPKNRITGQPTIESETLPQKKNGD